MFESAYVSDSIPNPEDWVVAISEQQVWGQGPVRRSALPAISWKKELRIGTWNGEPLWAALASGTPASTEQNWINIRSVLALSSEVLHTIFLVLPPP